MYVYIYTIHIRKKDGTKSCPTLVTLWIVACQAPLSWDSPGKNIGVGCHFLLQAIHIIMYIFLTSG